MPGLGRATKRLLDMSKAARMKRAAEQGWGVNSRMFHGTGDDVAAFSPAHYGKSTGAHSAKQGTWLVDDGKTARGYADYAAMDSKVKALVDKSQRLERGGKWDEANDAIIAAENLESEFYQNRLQGQNIMPLYTKGKYLEHDFGGAEFVDVDDEIQELIRQAKIDGYDGVKLHNLADDVALNGRPATHQLVFEPENIRSVNAAFDPENIGKNDLLGKIDPEVLKFLTGAGIVGVGAQKARQANKGTFGQRQSGLGQTLATVGSAIGGGLVGDLSRLGGYLNPFMPVERTEQGAQAIQDRLQYRPGPEAAPYLQGLGRHLGQFEKDLQPLMNAWEASIPGRAYQSLPPRIQGLLRSAADLAM